MDEKILNSLLDYAREYMGAEIPFNNKWIIENFLIAERIKLSEQQSNCNLPENNKSSSDMEKQIENILIKVDEGTMPVQQALSELLLLFSVSCQCEACKQDKIDSNYRKYIELNKNVIGYD